MYNILVIVDNKLSSRNQCNAIVNEMKTKSQKKIKVKYLKHNLKFLKILPNPFIYFFLLIKSYFEQKQFHDLDFIISCGRVSAPLNLILKRINKCKNCHILNPYFKKKDFDKIIIPNHDLSKNYEPNIIPILGTLTDTSQPKQKKKEINYLKKIFKKKVITMLIGGSGKSSMIKEKDIKEYVTKLNNLSDNYEIVYCFSRRTPQSLKNIIKLKAQKKCFFFPEKGFNPYWSLLNISSYIFVTSDSVSMVSDSLAFGKRTYLIPVKKIKKKILNFNNFLLETGKVKIFQKDLESWAPKKSGETKKISSELIKFLQI